jgi:hypothetical protein
MFVTVRPVSYERKIAQARETNCHALRRTGLRAVAACEVPSV